MADIQISLNSLIQANEIRQQAVSNKEEYIPPLFEVAKAIEADNQKNVRNEAESVSKQSINNTVLKWLKNQLTNLQDRQEAISQNTVTNGATEASEQTQELESIQNDKASNSINKIYNQIQDLGLAGVKVEIVKQSDIGI